MLTVDRSTDKHLKVYSLPLEMEAGEMIEFKLYSIPSSGYVWTVQQHPQGLKQIAEACLPAEVSTNTEIVGNGVIDVLRFIAEEDLVGTIVLLKTRPWLQEQ